MVNVEEIKTAIAEREEDLLQKFSKENIIVRGQFNNIQHLISTDAVVIITGVRRCGKSILAFMLGKAKKYAYINFDDERLTLEASELNKVLEAAYSLKNDVDLLIFDEIQNINGWERFVARIITNKKIIITGSNAHLLSKELATYLTGRHIDFILFPFSFREFLQWKNFEPNLYITKDVAQVKNYLKEYLEKGGFPLTYKLGNIFLLETYRDILERDVVQRYNIKYVKVLKEISKYLISNVSQEISYNKLRNIFEVKSSHTIKNYISYLQNAYLIFLVERFSFKLKEQALAPKKIYCIDIGLANVIGFNFLENRGKVMENAIAIELWRRIGLNKTREIYYWKDHQQLEVDFIIKEGKKIKQLIQACYDISNQNTKEREIKALLKASHELKCKNALIITYDMEKEEKYQGLLIKYTPFWRWLLSEQ